VGAGAAWALLRAVLAPLLCLLAYPERALKQADPLQLWWRGAAPEQLLLPPLLQGLGEAVGAARRHAAALARLGAQQPPPPALQLPLEPPALAPQLAEGLLPALLEHGRQQAALLAAALAPVLAAEAARAGQVEDGDYASVVWGLLQAEEAAAAREAALAVLLALRRAAAALRAAHEAAGRLGGPPAASIWLWRSRLAAQVLRAHAEEGWRLAAAVLTRAWGAAPSPAAARAAALQAGRAWQEAALQPAGAPEGSFDPAAAAAAGELADALEAVAAAAGPGAGDVEDQAAGRAAAAWVRMLRVPAVQEGALGGQLRHLLQGGG
jgi:hypothetical protein